MITIMLLTLFFILFCVIGFVLFDAVVIGGFGLVIAFCAIPLVLPIV